MRECVGDESRIIRSRGGKERLGRGKVASAQFSSGRKRRKILLSAGKWRLRPHLSCRLADLQT